MHTEHLSESIRDGGSVCFVGEASSKCRSDRLGVGDRQVGRGGEELDQRRERHALSVRGRLRDEDAGAPPDSIGERLSEPGLADARWSEDRDEDARLTLDRVFQRVLQHGHGARPSDERRLRRRGSLPDAEDPEDIDRFGLALQRERRQPLGSDVAPRETLGRAGDEHVADVRRRLEPRRGVEHVAGDPALDRGTVVSERLARIDADANLDARVDADLAIESRRQPRRISRAARTARSASSSCEVGIPNAPTTASPMNFSTVPPCRSIDARIVVK